MSVSRLFFLAIICLLGCQVRDREPRQQIVREFYQNGKIKAEYETVDSVRQGTTKIYYPNGQLQFKLNYKNDLLDGLSTEYYPSGKLKKIGHFSKDKMNGDAIIYFENGNIASKGKYFNDLVVGNFYEYFEERDKQLKSEKEYVIIGGKSHLNTYTKYDVAGNTIDRSPYLDFSVKDGSVTINVLNKEFGKINAVLGDYNTFFKLKTDSQLDTIKSLDNKSIEIPYHKGDTIRGYVDNYDVLDSEKMVSRYIWFSYPNPW